ncbi:type II toxin-antitoxin system SpoIISA family toxin [Paenibacillus illinoisensis]|uniref:type II toxin-antitoxin system SpoIISA family toxin n=1 Tax=Paenibacillus illinoisensis TaxID=59845 RepID=UPI003D291036
MFYFGWMVIGFMSIAGLATMLHWWKPNWYSANIVNIRKSSYAIMALTYGGMILAGHILLNDWVKAVQFASIAIFIDLAILETPSISKIGNTELKKNDLVIATVIENSTDIITAYSHKVDQFTTVVQYTEHHFSEFTEEQIEELPKWEIYSILLKEYLSLYTDTFGLRISTKNFIYSSDVEVRKQKILDLLTPIERTNNLSISGELKENIAAELTSGASFVLEEDKVVLAPFYGTTNSFIVIIQTHETNAVVSSMDVKNIINLVQIFDWFVDE